MRSRYEVWGDNMIEIQWFIGLHGELRGSKGTIISPRGRNHAAVDSLIKYDRPDIILLKDGSPVLVIEKTREVPTGHNVGQRLARIVRAAEFSIPVVKFFPFDATKHGRFSGMCHMNARLLAAFAAMERIHSVPVLAINWPHDSNGELVMDGSEDEEMRLLIADFLKNQCAKTWPAAKKVSESMVTNYELRVSEHPAYGVLPPSVTIIPTSKLPAYTGLADSQFVECGSLRQVKSSVVYSIGMSAEKCRRQDPFTGCQFLYDYLECRSGVRVENKSKNLILWFPHISKKRFLEANPNDPARKSSNWYLTANALVFSDEVLLLRGST